ncbi:hypothetical protein niasHT_008184 [Heterodera trifolii]|uniref:Secreted protein n=1 Tax=Heterodera trifolii TaxID=157864 RepID=A0ABD2LUB1_9BILA
MVHFRRPATALTSAAAALPLVGAVVAAAGDHRHNGLCVILEKTRSKLDTTVECDAQLWRTADGTAQERRRIGTKSDEKAAGVRHAVQLLQVGGEQNQQGRC